jgi:sec-independent protein translocase protein TatB
MLSIPHLIIVFIVALVVFGPEKLPELARNLGKIMGEFKRHTGDLRTTFEGHLRDLERETDQRRARNETQTAATAIPSATASPQLPEASAPVPGSVATVPPHIAGTERVADPAAAHISELASSVGLPPEHPPSPLDPEHNPETLTDAGTHPA